MQRQNSKNSHSKEKDPLVDGFRGFGMGILGGVTSIFTETYEGAANNGVGGFFSGLGKGVIGTVVKPVVGVADLASGIADTVQQTSKKSPRYVKSDHKNSGQQVDNEPEYLPPTNSSRQNLDEKLPYELNNRSSSEWFIAKEIIRPSENLQVLVSNVKVYFVNLASSSHSKILLCVNLEHLTNCSYVQSHSGVTRHYIQFYIKDDHPSGRTVSGKQSSGNSHLVRHVESLGKKTQVRCDSREKAEKVVQQINYAKTMYEDSHSVLDDDDDVDICL